MGSVFASNMIHPSEGKVTFATRVRGAIVYQLESTELVRPGGGWEEIKTEGNKWDKVLEDCSGASVGESSVDALYALLDVAYGTLHYVDMHAGAGSDELDARAGELCLQGYDSSLVI